MPIIGRINGSSNIYVQKNNVTPVNFGNKKELNRNDKSNNGQFDTSEAGKNFIKGVFSPITAVFKHPLATIGIVAGTIAACAAAPVLGAALTLGFGGYSVFQIAKGSYNAAKNYKNGDYDAAEKSFNTIGEGVVGTFLSALGVKQSARVVKEAKYLASAEPNSLSITPSLRAQIAQEVKQNGFIANLKETVSLFTTNSGLKAIKMQLKPSNMIANVKNIFNKSGWIKEKEIKTEQRKNLDQIIAEFKQSPEGIRRAALTDEQIEAEFHALINDSFDRLGVPKNQRPKIELKIGKPEHGGGYSKGQHLIEFNPESYRAGILELEDIAMHEATHCQKALMRAGIPQDRVDQIITDELIGRVRNGEAEKIVKGIKLLGADMATPPKMSSAMKEDFIQFAKDYLYNKDNDFCNKMSNYDHQLALKRINYEDFKIEELQEAEKAVAPILDKLKALMKRHPDFVKQYGTEQEALQALFEYSQAHNFRYQYFTNTKINRSMFTGDFADYVDVEPLTGDALAEAEQSLIDEIATVEGNSRNSGIKIFGPTQAEFNQYQFSPEEVLAQENGNNYLIEKMTNKLNSMKEAGTLTPEQEAFLTKTIERAKIVIEYKTKGLEYYEKYTQSINHPEDAELAQAVKAMGEELEALKAKMTPEEWKVATKTIEMLDLTPISDAQMVIPQILNMINHN